MKKRLLAIMLLASLMLCACAGFSREEKMIQTAWKSLRLSAKPQRVFIMEYTNRSSLSDESLNASLRDEIPYRGYAIIFSAPKNVFGFRGQHTLFVDEEGGVIFEFDYTEQYEKYETAMAGGMGNRFNVARAVTYLEECNYFAGMQNFAFDEAWQKRSGKDLCKEKNVWYILDDEQLNKVLQ